MSESNSITITDICYKCQAYNELCPDCEDMKENRDVSIAYEIVDDGNLQYNHIWSVNRPEPSGHDWTEREDELRKPIAVIADSIYDLETSLTVTNNEIICPWCNLLTPKQFNDCQNIDCNKPLEHNVRKSI